MRGLWHGSAAEQGRLFFCRLWFELLDSGLLPPPCSGVRPNVTTYNW